MTRKTIITILKVVSGMLLVAGYLLTGTYGLSPINQRLYQEALALQPVVDDLNFSEFRLSDYPVAIYDGKHDYVLDNGKDIVKRQPVLGALAATTYEVNGHYEVFIPEFKTYQMMEYGTADSESKNDVMESHFISMIWHEAFHAWQMTHYFPALKEWGTEELDIQEIDGNPAVKELYTNQYKLLKQAVLEEDTDIIKQLVREFLNIEAQRQQLLPEEVIGFENRTELLEGSAYYVESQVILATAGKERYHDYYISDMAEYREGRIKYYVSGMAKLPLLDKLGVAWKNEFNMSRSITDLLAESLE